mmetsp:Transcript_21224/g.28899  ORF Transcript_21224/g.28899 Transcript_21224/m.28899 type:complete len:289 (-) Transcript_21224:169-1035(-)
MREYLVLFRSTRRSESVAFASRASTSTLWRMTSLTLVSCRSRTPSTIFASSVSIPPDSRAPMMSKRSSSSETNPVSCVLNPKIFSTLFASHEKASANGENTVQTTVRGGTRNRATTSAFDTPSAFGISSPKKMVMRVSMVVALATLSEKQLAICVKRTVDVTVQHVVSTRIVVRTRVMSSCRNLNGDFGPSSSANSRTFQGYRVVIAISAAWRPALAEKRTIQDKTRGNPGAVTADTADVAFSMGMAMAIAFFFMHNTHARAAMAYFLGCHNFVSCADGINSPWCDGI